MNRKTQPQGLGTFIAAAIRRPAAVGTLAPTLSATARTASAIVPKTSGTVVVELGAGTGALSDTIHERLPADSRHVSIELDPAMAQYLRETRPWMEVIEGDAARLTSLLAEIGVTEADAVVTALPWSMFPVRQQVHILDQISQVLRPEGAFSCIALLPSIYSAGARMFRRQLEQTFDEVLLTHTVWANVPPARAYVCRRPLGKG